MKTLTAFKLELYSSLSGMGSYKVLSSLSPITETIITDQVPFHFQVEQATATNPLKWASALSQLKLAVVLQLAGE